MRTIRQLAVAFTMFVFGQAYLAGCYYSAPVVQERTPAVGLECYGEGFESYSEAIFPDYVDPVGVPTHSLSILGIRNGGLDNEYIVDVAVEIEGHTDLFDLSNVQTMLDMTPSRFLLVRPVHGAAVPSCLDDLTCKGAAVDLGMVRYRADTPMVPSGKYTNVPDAIVPVRVRCYLSQDQYKVNVIGAEALGSIDKLNQMLANENLRTNVNPNSAAFRPSVVRVFR